MLIDFTVKNFRSIRDAQTFSMETLRKVKELPENTFNAANHELLKTALVYGRNSAGKSNLLKAFGYLQSLIRRSRTFDLQRRIGEYLPFLFDATTATAPVEFSITFFASDNIKYEYSIAFTASQIKKESLYYYPNKVKAKLFDRVGMDFTYGNLKGNKKDIESSLYKNQLFLSKVGINKLPQLSSVYQFFNKHILVHIFHDTDIDDRLLEVLEENLKKEGNSFLKQNINLLIKSVDTNIESLVIKKNNADAFDLPENISDDLRAKVIKELKTELKTEHLVYNNGEVTNSIEMPIREESTGTIKFLSVATLILITLNRGGTIIIDELDKSLHPHLTAVLIRLFLSPKNNPNNAQLIFATHDSNLMSSKYFRRDQIWITEKEQEGYTELYSLGDLKGVRKDIDYEKYYLEGAFGGVPMINEYNINLIFEEHGTKQQASAE